MATYGKFVCGYTDKHLQAIEEEIECGAGCLKWHKSDFVNYPNVINLPDTKDEKNPFNFTAYLHESLEVST